jgi:hypothetical protein
VIGLSFSRQIGAVLIFSLVSSLLIFICCNCGQCYKTRVISGHVLVGAPDMALPHDQQIAVIIVSPSSSSARQRLDDSLPHSSAVAPMYPVYGPTHFQPPPSYDESQRQYKWVVFLSERYYLLLWDKWIDFLFLWLFFWIHLYIKHNKRLITIDIKTIRKSILKNKSNVWEVFERSLVFSNKWLISFL